MEKSENAKLRSFGSYKITKMVKQRLKSCFSRHLDLTHRIHFGNAVPFFILAETICHL